MTTTGIDTYTRTLALIKGIKAAGVPIVDHWFTSDNGLPPKLSYIDLGASHLEALAAAVGVTA